MAGKENVRGQLPEGQEEPQLPDAELAQRAYQLIKDFKQAIKQTPEFAQALQQLYFAEIPHEEYSMWKASNPFEMPIAFEKNDFVYDVKYSTDTEREDLQVSKSPVKPKEHEWWIESVTLSARVNGESRRFDRGTIQHAIFRVGAADYPTNTPTALQRVEGFLNSNFGSK